MKRKAAQNISKYNIPANATQGFNIEVNCLWGEHIADKEWYDRPRPQSRFSLWMVYKCVTPETNQVKETFFISKCQNYVNSAWKEKLEKSAGPMWMTSNGHVDTIYTAQNILLTRQFSLHLKIWRNSISLFVAEITESIEIYSYSLIGQSYATDFMNCSNLSWKSQKILTAWY